MPFDIEGARGAGYSDGEIADYLGKESGFDVAGAKKAGYTPAEIVGHLSVAKPAKPKTAPAADIAPSDPMGSGASEIMASANPVRSSVLEGGMPNDEGYNERSLINASNLPAAQERVKLKTDAYGATNAAKKSAADASKARELADVSAQPVYDPVSGAQIGQSVQPNAGMKLPDRTGKEVAGDVTAASFKIGPTALKNIAQMYSMGTGGLLGAETSKLMDEGMASINQQFGSKASKLDREQLDQLLKSPDSGAGELTEFLTSHPMLMVDMGITTVGSMFVPVGVVGAVGKIMKAPMAARTATEINNLVNAAMNSADTFEQTKGDYGQKLFAGAIAAVGSYGIGRATGGGIEGQMARQTAGHKAVDGIHQLPKELLKESAQEYVENSSQQIGQDLGEQNAPDLQSAHKQGVLGALIAPLAAGPITVRNALTEVDSKTQLERDLSSQLDGGKFAPATVENLNPNLARAGLINTPAPVSTPAQAIAKISSATSVDGAIAAANEAVNTTAQVSDVAAELLAIRPLNPVASQTILAQANLTQQLAPEVLKSEGDGPVNFNGGGRWKMDRGAMPGEPIAYLDGDPDTAKAAMREVEVPGKGSYFEVTGDGGRLIASGSTASEAAKLAVEYLDKLQTNVQNPIQTPTQPGTQTQAAPAKAPEVGAAATSGQPAAGIEARNAVVQADGLINSEVAAPPQDLESAYLGRNNVPMSEGGKPFKTNQAAQNARQLNRTMRVVRVEGGFALKPASEAQLAAADRAARRMALPRTSPAGEAIPAHAFIAAKGGLAREAMSDIGIDRNVMIGNRFLFGRAGVGLSVERATEYLIEEGYLPPDASHSQALSLIKRSLTNPQYTPEGTERMAEKEAQTRFADFAAVQQEAADQGEQDPFLLPTDFTPQEKEESGYNQATQQIQAEVNALVELADSMGIDSETIKLDAHDLTREGSEKDYYDAAKSALEAAIAGSRENSVQAPGAAGPAGSRQTEVSDVDTGDLEKDKSTVAEKSGADADRDGIGRGVLRDTGIPPATNHQKPADTTQDGQLATRQNLTARQAQVAGERDRLAAQRERSRAARGDAGKPPAGLSIGIMPNTAEPVTVKDGVVYIGKYEAVDFDSSNPIKVSAEASDADIKKALTDGGAVAKNQRFFGGEKVAEAPILTAPTQAQVLDQQERKDNADELDQRQQIDREASGQTLTQQTAPEQRSDNSGDMFAMEKAQAEIDKRNAGQEAKADPNQDGLFASPAVPVTAEAAQNHINNADDLNTLEKAQARAALRTGELKPEDVAPAPKTKIEDFGQKLEGARKDYAAKLKDAETVDIAAEPLSKSWPEPDYKKLLEGGANSYAVAFVHAARDMIPTKPKQSWKLARYVEQVKLLRDVATQILDGRIDPTKVQDQLSKFASLQKELTGTIHLYQLVGHSKSLKGMAIDRGEYSYYDGVKHDTPKVMWTVGPKNSPFSRETVSGDTRQQALDAFVKKYQAMADAPANKKSTEFQIFSSGGKYFVGKKLGKDVARLKSNFDTIAEARKYRAENQAELETMLTRYKDTPFERSNENQPRIGEDHRNGARVTPEVFNEAFGFRGVQFGNYVEDSRRQSDLNNAYDGLSDLSAVIGVPTRALSLDGKLGLAFGARGSGGKNPAAAHYESDLTVINLTKNNGAGSLAHEWFHAVDNYFAKMKEGKGDFITNGVTNPGMRPEMAKAFDQLMTAIRLTGVRTRSRELDKRRSAPYWSGGEEMAARSFESYIISKLHDQNASNDYLANVVGEDYWKAQEALMGHEGVESYPYPTEKEMATIRPAFDKFFAAIETKDGDNGNVVMYAKDGEDSMAKFARMFGPSKGMKVEAAQAAVDRISDKWTNAPNITVVATTKDLPSNLNIEGNPRGVYSKGQVWIVAGNNMSADWVARTLAHEAIAHHGLREALGSDRWKQLMRNITLAAKSGNTAIKAHQDYVRNAYADLNLNPNLEADEIAARVVEAAVDPVTGEFKPGYGFVKQVYARLAEWLRSKGFDIKFTTAELHGMLMSAMKNLEIGQRLQGGGDMVAAAKGEPQLANDNTAGRDKAFDAGSATVVSTFPSDATLKAHPDYRAAKSGDVMAAARLVSDLVTPENIRQARAAYGKDVIYVPVHAEEATGMNQIPNAMAAMYAARAGGEVDAGMVQSNRAFHTGAKAMERLLTRAQFTGPVEAGAKYVLVDDVTTMGSTLADLASYVRSNGGEVAGSAVLVNAMRGATMTPSATVIKQLEVRHGDEISNILGIEPAALTAAEAGYLIGFRSTDELRNRAAAAQQERVDRLASKGLSEDHLSEGPGQLALDGNFDPSNPNILYAKSAPAGAIDIPGDLENPTAKPYTGPGADMLEGAKGILQDVYMGLAPMSAGTQKPQAAAQQFMNDTRVARFQWSKMSELLKMRFSKDERAQMWEAAEEQNNLLQQGEPTEGKGLGTLTQRQRDSMEVLHAYANELWTRAKAVGMVSGDGLPFWTPRMAAIISEDGTFSKPPEPGKKAMSDGTGRNVFTTAPSAKHRKHETLTESEAALKSKLGDNAQYVRDIITMPLAMSRFEQAIAGRELVNTIKEIGLASGQELVNSTGGPGFFTLDHPAFSNYRPRMVQNEDGKTVPAVDQNGGIVMDRTPIFIDKSFQGPLKAVMTTVDNKVYTGYMLLKSKAMSAIMYSPLIHNQVIFGRALGYARTLDGGPLKTVGLYFTGHAAKRDTAFMQQMIESGMVPIGERNSMLDVGDVANDEAKEGTWLDPNESWIGLTVKAAGNSVYGGLGNKIKDGFDPGIKIPIPFTGGKTWEPKLGLDPLGDFWHNTLLWRLVGDLQAGIAKDAYDSLTQKGFSADTAAVAAAHLANRYAGAIGQENMSKFAHMAANITLFSKSFNAANIGTVKDAAIGTTAGLRALIQERAETPQEAVKMLDFLKNKARFGLVKDLAYAIIAQSLAQMWFKRDKDEDWTIESAKRGWNYQTAIAMKAYMNWKENPYSPGSYNPFRLSGTFDNEPGKQERVFMGIQESGRAQYMRLPGGKVVEDLINWTTDFAHTLDAKKSPFIKALDVLRNKKDDFGTPIWDNRDPNFAHRIANAAEFLLGTHMPIEQAKTIKDMMAGVATPLDKEKTIGNFTGLSVSQGHPRGPEAGVEFEVEKSVKGSQLHAMDEVNRLLKYSKSDEAWELLEKSDLTPKEIGKIIQHVQDPKAGISRSTLSKFNHHATESERRRYEEVNQ